MSSGDGDQENEEFLTYESWDPPHKDWYKYANIRPNTTSSSVHWIVCKAEYWNDKWLTPEIAKKMISTRYQDTQISIIYFKTVRSAKRIIKFGVHKTSLFFGNNKRKESDILSFIDKWATEKVCHFDFSKELKESKEYKRMLSLMRIKNLLSHFSDEDLETIESYGAYVKNADEMSDVLSDMEVKLCIVRTKKGKKPKIIR